MGNCSSENHAKLFRAENFSNDPTAFRVFVKKKNKFIPGWLKINDEEIVFTRGGGGTASANNFQFWPLAYLRRYGYTCSGIFFFESGRRCATGEGLHTFQSHQAEKIFHMVQGKIKIEEYARGSRASSVISNNRTNNVNNSNRIHPVQRFSSEGLGTANEFCSTASSSNSNYMSCAPSHPPSITGAPPPYEVYQRTLQETLNRRLYSTGGDCGAITNSAFGGESSNGGYAPGMFYRRQRLPSTSSAYSANAVQPLVNGFQKNENIYGHRERPRSVVSAIEHGIYNVSNEQPHAFMQMSNAQVGGSVISPSQQPNPTMFESFNSSASNTNYLMDRSFNSSINGGICNGSPWVSQQQLEGEIVLEHVLSKNSRKNYQQQMHGQLPPANYEVSSVSSITSPLSNGTNNLRQRKYHSYVNVDLPPYISLNGNNSNNNSCGNLSVSSLAARELHRTSKSRQEFLSSQPGGFVFNNTFNAYNPLGTAARSSSLSSPPSGDLSSCNFQSPSSFNDQMNESANIQQNSSAFHSITPNYSNNITAKLRKRIPQLPPSPSCAMSASMVEMAPSTDSSSLVVSSTFPESRASTEIHPKQNYAVINIFRPMPPHKNIEFINGKDGDLKNVTDIHCDVIVDSGMKKVAQNGSPKTNYATIDFDKTKTLEKVTNIKQNQEQLDDPTPITSVMNNVGAKTLV